MRYDFFNGVFRRGKNPPVIPGDNKNASAKEKPL